MINYYNSYYVKIYYYYCIVFKFCVMSFLSIKVVSMASFIEITKQSMSYSLVEFKDGSCYYVTNPFLGKVYRTRLFKSYDNLKTSELRVINKHYI